MSNEKEDQEISGKYGYHLKTERFSDLKRALLLLLGFFLLLRSWALFLDHAHSQSSAFHGNNHILCSLRSRSLCIPGSFALAHFTLWTQSHEELELDDRCSIALSVLPLSRIYFIEWRATATCYIDTPVGQLGHQAGVRGNRYTLSGVSCDQCRLA